MEVGFGTSFEDGQLTYHTHLAILVILSKIKDLRKWLF